MDRNAFLALLFSLIVFMLWTQWQAVRFGDGAPPPGMEGAPETVPAGNPARSASTAVRFCCRRPVTFEVICMTWL